MKQLNTYKLTKVFINTVTENQMFSRQSGFLDRLHIIPYLPDF